MDATKLDLAKWQEFVSTFEIDLLFVTVSGAHLYGFPSPDSDIDLRGSHLLPLDEVVGLVVSDSTFEKDGMHEGIETDIVSHDIGKYLSLLVKNNGYILEQIFSPLIVHGSNFLAELRPLAKKCITKHHYHHYAGFYTTQRKLIEKQPNKTAKAVLYAYRVLMTGIHLLHSGEVEANLRTLNDEAGFRHSFISDLIESKTAEKISPSDLDWEFHAEQLDRLAAQLSDAFVKSKLPTERDKLAINRFLVDVRLGNRCFSK